GATDESAINIIEAQDRARIGRFYGAAIENSNGRRGRTKSSHETISDVSMHLLDFGNCRRAVRADSPHRLVGDDGILRRRPIWNALAKMIRADVQCHTSASLQRGLTDADDGKKTRTSCGFRFGSYLSARLTIELASLGMTDDYRASAGILQHLRTQ